MIKASMKSQIGNAPCEAEDTEEMFWLRQNDDYQSREKLGTALAAQYRYRPDLEVGHHTAYRTVVSVLAKETTAEEVMKRLAAEKDDLNYCIVAYGMHCILRARGDAACEPLLQAVLARDSVWPCIAYLAAWNDALSG